MTTSERSTTSAAPSAVAGDKLAGKVALVTGGTRRRRSHLRQPGEPRRRHRSRVQRNITRAEQFKEEFAEKFHTPVTVHQGMLVPAMIADESSPIIDQQDDRRRTGKCSTRSRHRSPSDDGRPEEMARIVHFLAADASSYITGQVWGVNGGMDM